MQADRVGDFKKADLQRYTIERRNEGISDNTIYHDQQTAQMFFGFCKEEGYLDKNPLTTFQKQVPAQVQVPTQSVDDLRLLAAIKNRNDPKVYDGAKTQSAGMRQFLRVRETAIVMAPENVSNSKAEFLSQAVAGIRYFQENDYFIFTPATMSPTLSAWT